MCARAKHRSAIVRVHPLNTMEMYRTIKIFTCIKFSALTRNAELTRFQEHRTMGGSVEANLLFRHDMNPKLTPGTFVRT